MSCQVLAKGYKISCLILRSSLNHYFWNKVKQKGNNVQMDKPIDNNKETSKNMSNAMDNRRAENILFHENSTRRTEFGLKRHLVKYSF